MIVIMKENSIFVVFTPRTFYAILVVVAISFATCMVYRTASKQETGYQILADCCTAKSVIVLGGTGGDSLFYIYMLFFHSQMPRTMKDCNNAQGAFNATSAHETRKSLYSKFRIEHRAKNIAYLFIASRGLIPEFYRFLCEYPASTTKTIEENNNSTISTR